MFLLDTNVVSEMFTQKPSQKVVDWIKRRNKTLYISSIAKAEIEYGINIMPDGKKKNALAAGMRGFINSYKKFCLPFDAESASYYAEIRAAQKRAGRHGNTGGNDRDAMIAAVAVQHKLILATRNAEDFDGIKHLQKVNPWN